MSYTKAVANWQDGSAGATPITEAALDHIEDGIVAAAAAADTANAGLAGKATTVHTHVSTSITDFVEAVQDVVGAQIVAGAGVTVVYDDAGSGSVTITSTGGGSLDSEGVRDTVAAALVAGTNITIVVNDAGDTITVNTSATVNSPDATLLARGNHTGFQAISTVTGLQAALDAKGTSNLVIGTTGSTAKAGNYAPTLADLPAGVGIFTSGTTRPTARTDIIVIFTGADPSTNAIDGVDHWIRP